MSASAASDATPQAHAFVDGMEKRLRLVAAQAKAGRDVSKLRTSQHAAVMAELSSMSLGTDDATFISIKTTELSWTEPQKDSLLQAIIEAASRSGGRKGTRMNQTITTLHSYVLRKDLAAYRDPICP